MDFEKNNSNTILKLAVVLLAMTSPQLNVGLSPALGAIGEAYSNIDPNTIKMLVTLPNIFVLLGVLLLKPFGRIFGPKKAILIGLLAFSISGILPFFGLPFGVLLALRCITGFGSGMFVTYSVSLAQQLFSGPTRVKMSGLAGAALGMAGLLFSVLCAILLSFSWNFVFLEYAFPLIAFVLILGNLPNLPKTEKVDKSSPKEKLMNKHTITICVFMAIHAMLFFVVLSQMALYVTNAKIAGAIATTLIFFMCQLGQIAGSSSFQKVYRKFPSYFVFGPYLFVAVGMLTISFGTSLIMVIVGAIIVALGTSIMTPFWYYITPSFVERQEKIPLVFSIYMLSVFFAQSMVQVVLNAISSLFGFTQLNSPFLAAAVIAIILEIAAIIFVPRLSKQKAINDTQNQNA